MENFKNSFVETVDVRDGLFPSLRFALNQMMIINDENEGKYRKSAKITESISEKINVDQEEVHDAFVNLTYPRCEIPLVDGHGNMGFPPASMYFCEMRVSNFYRKITDSNKSADFSVPLKISLPCLLVNGIMGFEENGTCIPSHNICEVASAAIALIKKPDLETKDLMQYIKGPDLLIGGKITNQDKLCEVYEKGYGIIEIKITPENVNDYYCDAADYCNWYFFKMRKYPLKEEWKITIKYNAYLSDGKTEKHMSLKEILQNYIDFCKSVENISDDDLCARLEEICKLSAERTTKI